METHSNRSTDCDWHSRQTYHHRESVVVAFDLLSVREGDLKIRNRNYSQWDGREELFERERERNPDTGLWDSCVMACAAIGGRM